MLIFERKMRFLFKCACALIFLLSIVAAHKFADDDISIKALSNSQSQNDKNQETQTYLRYKEQIWSSRNRDFQNPQPPPINQYALMARFIVNQADWAPVATVSSQEHTKSYPFVNVISISDGVKNNGSGIPYLFLTPLDFTAQDISKDNRATLLMSLAQGEYCKSKDYDPMDPRCARVMLTGKIKPVKNNTAEHAFAEEAMFGRHPWLSHMPADHRFFFAKLKIYQIALLDTFGGPKYISVPDYLHPPTNNITAEFLRWYKSFLFDNHQEPKNQLEDAQLNQHSLPSVLFT